MDKCREAFENSLGHTDGFHDGYVTYNPITGMYESNDDDYECVADWLNGALSVWQSRQAEINQLQSQINEMAEVGLSQESVIREKDKRINQALNFINNWWHPDLDQKLFVEALGRALRGEHE
ncbi:hypothetical protein [Acinetobacter bereziniae]|uniref:hypothetical protein n=1 Tax=Acinetobacter bereziniae TaxID=106648 RepID=UPI00125FE5C0|nr:hypothetical protein [Acinetobacter bereziniae]